MKQLFPEELVEYLKQQFGRRMTLAELVEAKIKWQKTRGKTQRGHSSINQPKSDTAMTEDMTGRQSTTATDTKHQRTRRWMHMRRRVEVTITLPKYLLEAIEGLAETVEKTKSAVIEAFAEYCLDQEDIIDKLFPIQETG